ncbi:TonB-dependent receptor plug domain-containing protein [Rhodobacter viridis]|uniref:TonB-dependent receptor plug domain-containing protein n=1 Tax=Rhodobacter viridis TaxID=1054202 RepID=UPI0015E890F4|nr:TonB-dependent receptor [Rhodobacter viridis]
MPGFHATAEEAGPDAAGVFALDTILVNGTSAAHCLPRGAARAEADTRPECLGRGVGRADLPGATLDASQFDRLPTGARANALIKRLPTITTGGGPGEDKDARIMGLDKEYTRTLVDGYQLPDGGEKREFNLDRFPVAMIDQVEVVRTKTADMETDGIAGKVILHSKDIPETLTRTLSVRGGQTSDGIGNFGISGHIGGMFTADFGAQAVINIARDGASKTKVKTSPSGAVERTLEEKPQPAREFLGDVMWRSEIGTFRFKPVYLDQTEEKTKDLQKLTADGAFNGSETGAEDKTKQTRGATLSWGEQIGGFDIEARAGYMRGDEDKTAATTTTTAAGAGTGKLETEDKADVNRTLEVDAKTPIHLGAVAGELKFGLALRDKSRDKTKVSNGAVATGKESYALDESYRAAYVMGKFDLGGTVTLKPGLRFEAVTLEGTSIGSGLRAEGKARDLLPSLAASWQINDRWTLSGGLGRSVNRPKFDLLAPFETTSGSTLTVGNPDLDPQPANTYDLDLTFKGDHAELVFGLWHRNIKGVIEEGTATGEIRDGKTVVSAQNVGDGTTSGVSLTQRISLAHLESPVLRGFTLGANENWASSKLHVAVTGATRKFKEQPNFWGDVFVEWTDPSERLILMAAYNYTGKLPAVGDSGTDWRESEDTLDLKVSYDFDNGTELYLLGENVLEGARVTHAANGDVTRETGPSLVTLGVTRRF